jgi:hypothetical protein
LNARKVIGDFQLTETKKIKGRVFFAGVILGPIAATLELLNPPVGRVERTRRLPALLLVPYH